MGKSILAHNDNYRCREHGLRVQIVWVGLCLFLAFPFVEFDKNVRMSGQSFILIAYIQIIIK